MKEVERRPAIGVSVIITDVCKTPVLRVKALKKHDMSHMMYFEIENVICDLTNS